MKPSNFLISATAILGLVFSSALLQAAPAPLVLSDNQVVGLLVVGNNVEVETGKIAYIKSQKKEVQDFALKMVVDHTTSNLKVDLLEVKAGLKRAQSPASRELRKNANTMIGNLKNAKDADFDRTYIDAQVVMHKELLTALDNSIIPNVKNPELKTFLGEKRAVVQAHLDLALKLQADLNAPAPTPTPAPTASPTP